MSAACEFHPLQIAKACPYCTTEKRITHARPGRKAQKGPRLEYWVEVWDDVDAHDWVFDSTHQDKDVAIQAATKKTETFAVLTRVMEVAAWKVWES